MMREEGTSEGVSPTSPASELPDDRDQDENDADACGWWAFPAAVLTHITLGRDTHLDVAARAKRGGEMMQENRKKNQENVTRPSRSAATRAADAAAAAAKAASEAARDWSPPQDHQHRLRWSLMPHSHTRNGEHHYHPPSGQATGRSLLMSRRPRTSGPSRTTRYWASLIRCQH